MKEKIVFVCVIALIIFAIISNPGLPGAMMNSCSNINIPDLSSK